MFARSRTLLTKLLPRNDHGPAVAFFNQVDDPLILCSPVLKQGPTRGMAKGVPTKKSLFNFHPTGTMDPDVAKVLADLKQIIECTQL